MIRLCSVNFALALPLSVVADDQVKWGEPINGLRIGIVNPPATAPSDQVVTFQIEAQNVSPKPIVLPAEGLYKFKRPDGVPVMIALLRDPATVHEDIVLQTLDHLTGQRFGANRRACLDWWERTGRAEYVH